MTAASLNGDVKSIPIRCVIEIRSDDSKSCNDSGGIAHAEPETFAIVPSNTLFKDVVLTVLLKLGYSTREASSAKGAVQIKKWRALNLEQVTDNEFVSVEDMLGDLANVATLRIKIISRPRSDDVKDKLLLTLLRQSYEFLISTGFPVSSISKGDLEKLVEGRKELSADKLVHFDAWHKQYLLSSEEENLRDTTEKHTVAIKSSPAPPLATPGKTRLRISFCSEEVAKLQQWFEIDPHPSRHAMTKYLSELNDLPARGSGLKPLDLTNIMYWFKNARAAARRNGRSIGSDDLSDEEGGQCERDPMTDMSAPPLPNSNAVYVIKDPLVPVENGEMKTSSGHQTSNCDGLDAEESDMDDLSVTDDESEINDGETYRSSEKNLAHDDPIKEEVKQEVQHGVSSTASSPKLPTNFVTPRLTGYPFAYGGFPMAYLQSQMNPFYKDWNEKLQSAVAHAQANTVQQNLGLLKPDPMKPDSELSKAERQKRHRAFIDPVSEIPKLEQWFTKDTHPSHYVIEQICDDLNRGEFRSRYPKLSPKNIQLWFKNHRAKVKRMRVGGSGLSFGSMESPQMKMSPPSGLSLAMMEGI